MDRGIDNLELAESTAIGDALTAATRLLVRGADDPEGSDDQADDESADETDGPAPGVIVLLSDGETTVGRETAEGADDAVEAGVPVFTIAFGTEGGTIADPVSGEIVPVPVRPADLADVAERTGGAAFEAETGRELADAYDEIRDSLGETLGEPTETITELTWRWALASITVSGRRLAARPVVAPRHGLICLMRPTKRLTAPSCRTGRSRQNPVVTV